jgi:spore coat protein U domain-containing protein, fimbrial subunit CupE1/2/3/6
MLSNSLKLAVAGTLAMAAVTAGAATSPATTTLNVSANVASNCLVTAAPLAFSDYDGSAAVDGSADLSVRCSNGTLYTISLGDGANGTIAQRKLESAAGDQLDYNLYTAAARSTIWGETVGVDTVGGKGKGMSTNQANTHTVYGTIPNNPANQDVPTGLYSDQVAVTVAY